MSCGSYPWAVAWFSRVFRSGVVVLASAGAALPACGASPQVHVTGSTHPRAVRAEELVQRPDVPHDHSATGTVRASCDRDASDCSELDLLRVMRQAAAEAGATAFVAPSCGDEKGAKGKRTLRCRATMARRRSLGAFDEAHVDVAQERRWEARVGDPSVLVTTRPVGPTRVARFEGVVERVWSAEEIGTVLGTVSVECQDRCQRADAEGALGLGAAELGAHALAEIRCHERRAGRWECSATAVTKTRP